jgi:hypothetical protein
LEIVLFRIDPQEKEFGISPNWQYARIVASANPTCHSKSPHLIWCYPILPSNELLIDGDLHI